ncbi:group II intron reverse transcriptase/maturase [Listeria rustica]|uniref:RNA-directed DNA polymerase n=1 Tax=Listeria rustica TaxID=2713503 RepID=A0A7W1T822_9LIST|nr:group II intron reverse transcriptase/maturase [Listeria rustica]MBA3927202.1 group II intron reverse transcriptase/maturase [Listeria rustica]
MYEPTLLAQIVNPDNLNQAYKQVMKNKGAAGVDDMPITALKAHLSLHKETLIHQIQQREYHPQPVKRVEIPKANGGVRLLGIPTVTDRFIQQAIAQVLTPIFDKDFHVNSYGFRPKRYAEMAILQSLENMNDGYEWLVDIDLERFFDTVHHDRLMNIVARTVKDGDVISLVRKFLVSGVMVQEEYQETIIGTPQGGNLSPLLSNIMLNELDKELASRELRFVRYADDCLIFVKSDMAARRVMRSVSKFIEETLGLIVNVTKSKVRRPEDEETKFLGFGFYYDWQDRLYKARPHKLSLQELKFKLKRLTRRAWGISTKCRVARINSLIRGWVNYFRIGKMKQHLKQIDANTRVRLRICIWKQWKTPKNRRKNLMKLGMSRYEAYKYSYTSKSYARVAYSWILTTTITNQRLAKFGLISATEHYSNIHV